jgi:hypothetical protein
MAGPIFLGQIRGNKFRSRETLHMLHVRGLDEFDASYGICKLKITLDGWLRRQAAGMRRRRERDRRGREV